jgi:hypothetical protein
MACVILFDAFPGSCLVEQRLLEEGYVYFKHGVSYVCKFC